MNIQKLQEVVTNQARQEANELIENTKKDIEKKLEEFMNALSKDRDLRLKDIEQSYQSSLSQVQFHADSLFKKKVLHIRHEVFQNLSQRLLDSYLKSVQKKPVVFLQRIVSSFPPSGDIYCSKEFEGSIDQKTFSDSGLTGNNYHFKGIDPILKPGISCISGKIKYIFLLEEDVSTYLQEHQKEIGDALFHD
jgi:vacuolar-type H+-ATPase subunit E/Vma4